LHEENKLLHERHSFNNKEFVRLHSVNAELLEALKTMLEHPDTMTAKLVAQAAIAKATGE
jgi:hypothetical protein